MSRYITYILRHGATKHGLSIDKNGYVNVDDLISFLIMERSEITTFEQIKIIVDEDDKQRMSLIQRDFNWLIRANQGHSIISVSDDFLLPISNASLFPEVIHGTFLIHLDSILKLGLSRMKRNHIHFGLGRNVTSGIRTNSDIFIYINIKLALEDSLKFFVSENKVVLSPGNSKGVIESKYFSHIVNSKGKLLFKS